LLFAQVGTTYFSTNTMVAMKRLYLIRHAKSSWKNIELRDIERPLNKRGKRDAPFMAQKMAQKGMQVDALVASPSQRTRRTAEAFAAALDYSTESIQWNPRIYEASARELLQIIQQWQTGWQSVALFAHNFACTDLANYYAAMPIENVPTTGVVTILFEVENWAAVRKHNGRVLDFIYPKLYFPK
jgi:phosphohistidine phosphatase